MWELGFPKTRIRHRLSLSLTERENQYANAIQFYNDSGIIFEEPSRKMGIDLDSPFEDFLLGDSHKVKGEEVEEPMESFANHPEPSPTEGFSNMNSLKGFNCELMLKAIFFGAIFYLLSLPDVYKITRKCCKSVDGVLLHSIVFAVIYFVAVQFI